MPTVGIGGGRSARWPCRNPRQQRGSHQVRAPCPARRPFRRGFREHLSDQCDRCLPDGTRRSAGDESHRSEEHTSELQSLMRISYAVFCLKKKKKNKTKK